MADAPPVPPTHTSLHAALGETGPLDHGMVLRAVAAHLPEDEMLDWKGAHYSTTHKEDPGGEFAKDVAALANARGGILLVGVVEKKGTGLAKKANPLDVTDQTLRQYRAWLGTRVTPALHGVRLVPLPDPTDAATGFLAVVVPASPDSPHMVGTEGASGYPVRVGTSTHWLREYEVERAYRDRFARDVDDAAALRRAVKDVRGALDSTSGGWLIAASRLGTPLPTWRGGPSLDEARAMFDGFAPDHALTVPYRSDRFFPLNELGAGRRSPRVGLRRWRWSSVNAAVTTYAQSDGVIVEVHHDGTVVMACSTEDPRHRDAVPGKEMLPDLVLVGLIEEFVDLCAAWDAQRLVVGPRVLSLEHLSTSGAPKALTAPSRYRTGSYTAQQVPLTRDLPAVQPVQVVATTLADRFNRRSVVIELLTDIVNQFGATLDDLAWPQYPEHPGDTDDKWYAPR